ncbi:hypothetical protein [cf. Phormidesmis sp. LEGE 11477]|uniref:hypothetical protein n=1 Tax=cf. Phormidesmis sp. LEGE 11477 TaxID=1828680 RepID=UPI00187F9A41|nr:hypothetical protein [cf. Phormidesmis sp. LEGE 11477]MBE9061311.1 hypothetical protein [cf. Phormidesmis sp. LEGE 11477]
MAFQTDTELKAAYAERLKQAGKGVSTDVPVGNHGSTVDILTECEVIFCTAKLDRKSALLMKSKLDFVSRFSPDWQRLVVVQSVVEPSAISLLTEADIQLIELSNAPVEGTTTEPKDPIVPGEVPGKVIEEQPQQTPFGQIFDRENLYAYPSLDSVEGGEGFRVALVVIGIVVLVGILGAVVSSVRSPEQPSSDLPAFLASRP